MRLPRLIDARPPGYQNQKHLGPPLGADNPKGRDPAMPTCSAARSVAAILLAGLLAALPPQAGTAQPPAADPLDEEFARQQIVARFVTVLERNPRRGTALDKIYGFHVENGSLEAFVKALHDRTAKTPTDGIGWMILGLVEAQRGRDAAAALAFTKAKELRPADPVAAYYLGQSLVLVGQPDRAAEAFEEAIARKPPQADLLEIFQALGRVHQRAQRTAEALAVWTRLEKLFPNDPRVQEQIAQTLVEEGQAAEALPRYEALAKSTTDEYRRTTYRVEAAELKVKLNRSSEAIADLESLLAKLNPESWLFREVRRKIEDVFLRTGDQEGLAKYYTGWLARNADDVDAMARLARVLARQGRVPEAQPWLDKALKFAPSRRDLRLAFIEQLIDDQRYPEALDQYAALDKAEPNNPDVLRDWGKLILRDASRPKPERQAEAQKIWQRMVAARPTDPLVATQVADLLRHAELGDAALALYQKAVELAPTQPQYREYLGEYYHILKRPAEAQATWRQIAEGPLRTAANLTRLAEVLAQFGYLNEALPEIAAAAALEPKDYSLQLKAADLQIRGEQYDDALASLTRADALAQNDEECEAVLVQRLKTYTLQNKLADLATQLAQETAKGNAAPAQWFFLARYREALREWPEATRAIHEALALQPNHVPSLAAAARIAEQSGNLKTSADLNRKLAVVDRKSRGVYLQHVAQLETQLGRIDEAIAAGRELVAATPGNVETYQFFADLCFRLGRPDDGLTALRRSARANPNEPSILLSLAAALAGQFRSDEAIEIYWQAFEKGGSLDDKLLVIGKLTELYLQTNHFDQLLERLERGRREDDQRREMTICLAQAYHGAGDYGMARQELERLLSENTRDTQLLLQLSKLAESESDLTSAVKFQEQLARLAPGQETEFRLATLLSRAGENEQAAAILVRLTLKEEDREKLLRNIDSLLANQQEQTALAVLEPKLRENAGDWELLYREGVALAKTKPEQAAERFQAILAQTLSDDELSTASKARQAAQRRSPSTTATSFDYATHPFYRLADSYSIRAALQLDPDRYAYASSSGTVTVWTPTTFGRARMAALGWLYRFALEANQSDEFVADRRKRAQQPAATHREQWDWVYLETIRGEAGDLLASFKRLAEQGDVVGQQQYLEHLGARTRSAVAGPTSQLDTTPPLPPADLELMLRSFEAVMRAVNEPQFARPSVTSSISPYIATVMAELRRAGRQDDEQRIYQQTLAKADSPAAMMDGLRLAVQRGDIAVASGLFGRLAQKDLQAADTRSAAARSARAGFAGQVAVLAGSAHIKPPEILKLLDQYLDYHAAWTNLVRQNPLSRTTVRPTSSSSYTYVTIGGVRRRISSSYPSANAYYDSYAITLLRTAFEQFKQLDLVSDFVKHLETRREKVAEGNKIYATLALAYAQVWNEEPEAAFQSLTAAAELVPQDVELRLDIARLHLQSGQLDEALAQVDAVTPLDQRVLQARETLALDLAVRLGDQDRARQAAERLFGLRLPPETQVQLAAQMRRLGMAVEAEAVIARAQRQAGNRLSALAALLTQYQSQGKMDIAIQIAHQILRRSRTLPVAMQMQGISTVDSSYRRTALQCLAQAGKLKELIAGIEAQLERSPNSMQLYETLAEYCQAAGDPQKSLELQARLVELRPDDGDLRFRYAGELQNRGKYSEACDQYLLAMRKQSRLIGDRYYYISEAFAQAKREADLIKLLNEIDIRSFGQPYYAINLIQNLMQREGQRTAALGLLKKAWEAFPSYRSNLMQSFGDSETWKEPEIFEFAKKSILPTADVARQSPWYGTSETMYYSSDGRVHTVLANVLEAGLRNNQLPALREEVARAAAEIKEWRGGGAVLALIDLKLGRPIEKDAAFGALLAPAANDYTLQNARWIVAQEIVDRPEWQAVGLELLKLAAADTTSSSRQFQYGPSQLLVRQYAATGRREEARQMLASAITAKPIETYSDPYYNLSRKMEDLAAVGRLSQELDFPVEALRAYRELLTNAAFSDPQITNYTGRNINTYRQQAQRGLETITAKLADDPTGQVAMALLAPAEEPAEGAAAIDLLLTIPAGDGPLARLDSALERMLKPQALAPAAAAKLSELLASLVEAHPRDASVRVVASLVGLRRGEGAAAVEDLVQFAAASPLEEIAPGQRPNSRQRREAEQHVGLWLVARECLSNPSLRAAGETLAARAVEAARRQTTPAMIAAILHEKGLLAHAAGDAAAAERDWNLLIDIALVQPRLPRPGAARSPAGAAARQPRASGPIPATISQFALAGALAEVAADKELAAVSLRAIREALSGGLPVPDLPQTPIGGPAPRIRPTSAAAGARTDLDTTVASEVAQRMRQLSAVWRKRALPPAEVCSLLEALVFPPQRPGDILLYETAVGSEWTNPRSVGRLLVEWSVRAGRTAELAQQIAARKATPNDVLAGEVLSVQLAVAQRDRAAAMRHLAAIDAVLESGQVAALTQAAAHAAGSAFDDPELTDAAAAIFAKIGQAPNFAANQPLSVLLANHAIRRGDLASAQAVVERYVSKRQASYANYGNDYGLYLAQQDLAWAADVLSRAGDVATTLAALARFADAPRYRNMEPSITVPAALLVRQARALPAAERYQLLRDWTLPTESRRSVRQVTAADPGQTVPAPFLSPGDPPYEPVAGERTASSLSLLIEAAAEAGQLDELLKLTQPLVAEKVPGADSLELLVLLAQRDASATARLAALGEAVKQRLAEKRDQARNPPPAPEWGECLAVQAALADPQFAAAAIGPAELLLQQAERVSRMDHAGWLRSALAQERLSRVPVTERAQVIPALAQWNVWPSQSGGLPQWLVHEGHLRQIAGQAAQSLVLRYPLAGEFELSLEARAEGGRLAVGYAGLTSFCEGQFHLSSVAQSDRVLRTALLRGGGGWERITVRVNPHSTRWYVNEHLAYSDDDPSRGSPWLFFQTLGNGRPAIRNLRLTGQPTIPRELALLDRDRLEGWVAFGGRLPPRLSLKEPVNPRQYNEYYDPYDGTPRSAVLPVYDWTAVDGVLSGRLDPLAAPFAGSHLQYHRPLMAGDRVRYQFRYALGLVHVHPAVGPVAFLLEPDGLKLHWTSQPGADVLARVEPDNALVEESSRRGPAKLPLKENDWNDVELAVSGDTLRVTLNSTLICERPIEPGSDQRFGLYHYKSQTAAEIRNVVLTGDWPQTLAANADLLAIAPQSPSPAALAARHALVGEDLLADDAYAVWQRAMQLPAQERFDLLRRWVMPSASHPTFGLQVAWTPTDPPPGSPHAPREAADSRSETAARGGELVAPALALLAAAQELGRLDELATAAALAAKELPDQVRNLASFAALLAIARGDDAVAAARLAEAREFVKQRPAQTPLHERHAEFLAAHAALARPALRPAALVLAEQIVKDQQAPRTVSPDWDRRVRRLLSVARWQAAPATAGQPFGTTPSLALWRPVSRPTARARGEGHAPPAWRLAAGEATYLTGNARDALYFAMPLTGDFEVRCQRTTFGWREIRPLYAGIAIDVKSDGLACDRTLVGRAAPTLIPLPAKLPNFGPTVEQRLVVKQGTLTVFMNGQQVHSERLPTHFDPWLALETRQPHNAGTIKSVEIIGRPTVPREVQLSAAPGLSGWSAEYYGETAGASGSTWTQKQDEIVATQLETAPGSARESVLQYHRPLLEDGTVGYEFFYEPGQTEVHPALDRAAFLLSPEGVRLHWLTDAQYDRTGIAPDNAKPLAGGKPVPLKAGEWNKALLTLQGDELAIAVNGVEVARHTLEPTNHRTLGLFRFADVSGVRVRNIIHRGQWPAGPPQGGVLQP